MKIILESKRPEEMRYKTLGDYFLFAGELNVQVVEMEDPVHAMALMVHELVEAVLATSHGIPFKAIDEFDMAHLDDEELGDHPEAPYHREHSIASAIERIVIAEAGKNWREYEAALERAIKR